MQKIEIVGLPIAQHARPYKLATRFVAGLSRHSAATADVTKSVRWFTPRREPGLFCSRTHASQGLLPACSGSLTVLGFPYLGQTIQRPASGLTNVYEISTVETCAGASSHDHRHLVDERRTRRVSQMVLWHRHCRPVRGRLCGRRDGVDSSEERPTLWGLRAESPSAALQSPHHLPPLWAALRIAAMEFTLHRVNQAALR